MKQTELTHAVIRFPSLSITVNLRFKRCAKSAVPTRATRHELTWVSNVVLLLCRTQFINFEYQITMFQNLVNLAISYLFKQQLVSFIFANLD